MMGGSFLAGANPAPSSGVASARRLVATERRDLIPGSSHATARYGHSRISETHDIDALGELVHEDCVFETTDPPDGTRHEGRAAVLRACREFFAQSPQARFEMEEILTLDDRALVRWRYAWADGHVRGIDVMRVRDGQVIETFAYVKG